MIKKKTTQYFVTIKDLRHRCNPCKLDYDLMLLQILKKYPSTVILEHCFESDTHNVLHLHMLINSRYINFNDIRRTFNMSVDFKEVKSPADFVRISLYMKKQNLSPDECAQINYKRTRDLEYIFI